MSRTTKIDGDSEALNQLAIHELTADLLPGRLLDLGNGERFRPYHIEVRAGREGVSFPLNAFLGGVVGGYESTIERNERAVQEQVPEVIASFVGAGAGGPGARLAMLQRAVAGELTGLRERLGRMKPAQEKTRREVADQQQRALGNQRGWLIHLPFEVAKGVQVFNQREDEALATAAVEAAVGVLGEMSTRLQTAQANLTDVREYARAAAQTLAAERAAARQGLTAREAGLIAWTPDTAQIAAELAGQATAQGDALRLLFAPPDSLAACLDELRARAAGDAARLVDGLTLEGVLELQRKLEGLGDDVPAVLLVGRAVLNEGCLAHSFSLEEAPATKGVLVQMTPDGAPLFQGTPGGPELRTAPSGAPGELGFLEVQHGIGPENLLIARRAYAALERAQAERNHLLIEELAGAVEMPGAAPASPAAAAPPPEPAPAAAANNGYAAPEAVTVLVPAT